MIKMKKILALILLIAVLSTVFGCAPKVEETEEDVSAADIEADIAEIDALEEDVDLSELDTLEEDLDSLI
jgi:hypothetical protein